MSIRRQHKRRTRCHRGRNRRIRPKTFDSEEKAKTWASKQGIKNFHVIRLNSGLSNKVKIIQKE